MKSCPTRGDPSCCFCNHLPSPATSCYHPLMPINVSLRLDPADLEALDAARGDVPRNTWVRRAIEERLSRVLPEYTEPLRPRPEDLGLEPPPPKERQGADTRTERPSKPRAAGRASSRGAPPPPATLPHAHNWRPVSNTRAMQCSCGETKRG